MIFKCWLQYAIVLQNLHTYCKTIVVTLHRKSYIKTMVYIRKVSCLHMFHSFTSGIKLHMGNYVIRGTEGKLPIMKHEKHRYINIIITSFWDTYKYYISYNKWSL